MNDTMLAGESAALAAPSQLDGPATSPQPSASAKAKPLNGTPAVNGSVPIPMSSRRSDRLLPETVELKGKRPRPPASRTHFGNIKEARTFKPTLEEWKNPMAYIRSITEEGSRYGVVKIVPPDSWNFEFAIDTEVRKSH